MGRAYRLWRLAEKRAAVDRMGLCMHGALAAELGISKRPRAEQVELRASIQEIALRHRRNYGYRRVTHALRDAGCARLSDSRRVRKQPAPLPGRTAGSGHEFFQAWGNLSSRCRSGDWRGNAITPLKPSACFGFGAMSSSPVILSELLSSRARLRFPGHAPRQPSLPSAQPNRSERHTRTSCSVSLIAVTRTTSDVVKPKIL